MPETRASHDAGTTLRTTARRSSRKRTAAVLEAEEGLVPGAERAELSFASASTLSLPSFAQESSIKKRTNATTKDSSELGEIGPGSAAAMANLSEQGKPSISTQKVAGPRKKKTIQIALETPHPTPNNWQETYALIKQVRLSIQAPVDLMGCDAPMKQHGDPRVCH